MEMLDVLDSAVEVGFMGQLVINFQKHPASLERGDSGSS